MKLTTFAFAAIVGAFAAKLATAKPDFGRMDFGEAYSMPVTKIEIIEGVTRYTASTREPVPAFLGYVQLIGQDGVGAALNSRPVELQASMGGMTFAWDVQYGGDTPSAMHHRLSGSRPMPGVLV